MLVYLVNDPEVVAAIITGVLGPVALLVIKRWWVNKKEVEKVDNDEANGCIIYTVKNGDTLGKIAWSYNTITQAVPYAGKNVLPIRRQGNYLSELGGHVARIPQSLSTACVRTSSRLSEEVPSSTGHQHHILNRQLSGEGVPLWLHHQQIKRSHLAIKEGQGSLTPPALLMISNCLGFREPRTPEARVCITHHT